MIENGYGGLRLDPFKLPTIRLVTGFNPALDLSLTQVLVKSKEKELAVEDAPMAT